MKKETIFKHELNESIQANAALNCLKNRNNHKQINEVAPVVAAAGRMLLPMLRPIITKLVQKALVKIGTHARPTQVITHVMGMLTKGEFAKKMAEKCGQTWNEIPSEVKKEIQDAIIAAFKKQAPQEQEEDYTNDEIPSPNFSYRMSFMVWAMREIIPYLKEISQVCAQADPTALKHAVMKILKTRDTGIPETPRSCQEWAKQNYDWVEMELNGEYDAYQKKWSKPFNIPSEQEETTDEKGAFALKLVKKFKNKMTPDYAKNPELFMMLKLQKALKKPLMSLSKEEYRAWAKAICDACESVFGTSQEQEESADEKYAIAKQLMANYNPDTDEWEDPSVWILYAIQDHIGKQFLKMPKKEVKAWKKVIDATLEEYELEKQQEEHSEDADRLQSQLANAWDEGMEDDEDDYVPYNNTFDETHHDIVDTIFDEVHQYFEFETDVEGFNLTEYTDEQIGKAIEQILDKTDDFPSSVSNNVCYAWVKKYAEEIIKVLETGSLENTYEGHPEFDFSEQEELPQMERHDMILALSEYMAESWIDTGDDGDLDDIYYAIADILDKTGDYPQSTDWEDCKPWCQKHYKEVEARIY